MNLGEALAHARSTLRDKEVADAALEGEVLLRHVLGINRARLFSSLEKEISHRQAATLEQVLQRRRNGEPTAYITGHREFFGLDFTVDHRVLIPRPESELLVEKAIELVKDRKISRIADIGTGSGAIAISLAVNLPGVIFYATDVSAQALEVAGQNCKKHGVTDKVVLLQGDMLKPLPCPVDLIIANLPYVRTADLVMAGSLSFEPALALNGGKDGLDTIRVLCRQAVEKLNGWRCLLLEVGRGQAEDVVALLRKEFPRAVIKIFPDLAGVGRVVSLCLT